VEHHARPRRPCRHKFLQPVRLQALRLHAWLSQSLRPHHADHLGTGEVAVAIKRPGYGGDYAGYNAADCVPVTGDRLRREIVCKPQTNLDALKGKNIRLKISGRNVVAYSATFEA